MDIFSCRTYSGPKKEGPRDSYRGGDPPRHPLLMTLTGKDGKMEPSIVRTYDLWKHYEEEGHDGAALRGVDMDVGR